jgi:hypothetical protein
VDIFYYFDKSTKRKAALSDYTQFCDLVYRKMLKHVTTRWLSLNTSVNRILSGYEGLKSYFLSEDDEDSKIPRFSRLRKHFENPMTEIYLMLFQTVHSHLYYRQRILAERRASYSSAFGST